jgi:YD repeat-containing protein
MTPSLVTSGSAFGTNAGRTDWGYDELGQLVRADHNTSDQSDRAYHYDKLGNRIHATDDQGTTQYQTNELNQYLSAGATNYQYDADGILVSDGLRTYRWNANNRLIEVKLGTVSLATYAYDHQGRRISKSTPQGTTQFVYDGWNLLAEYQDNSLKNSYLWGPDLSGSFQGAGGVGGLLSVSDENGTTFYATYDGNGPGELEDRGFLPLEIRDKEQEQVDLGENFN